MTEIQVTDVNISFNSMIGLVFKYWVASLVVWLMMAIGIAICGGLFLWLTH